MAVLIAVPEGNEEWEDMDVGDTYEATILLRKGEDGQGTVIQFNGEDLAEEAAEEAVEEMEDDGEMDMIDTIEEAIP